MFEGKLKFSAPSGLLIFYFAPSHNKPRVTQETKSLTVQKETKTHTSKEELLVFRTPSGKFAKYNTTKKEKIDSSITPEDPKDAQSNQTHKSAPALAY